ncbi:hypothetical protein RB601_003871 [Gaeumannomyces tritici]
MAEQGQTLLRNLEQSEARNTADCNEWLGQLHALTKSTVGRELAASLTSADLAVIARFGFGCGCDPTSGQISALRCLNNVLVLHTPIEQMFVDACLPEKAIELLNKGPDLGELAARLLLRVSQHLKPHLANHHLTDAVNGLVVWKRLRSSSWMHPTLLISPSCRSLRPGPLEQPIAQLIDCLATLLPSLSETMGVQPPTSFHADKLANILGCAIRAYRTQADFETRITPLVSLMYHVSKWKLATSDKQQMQSRLLATNQDRQQPLGRGDSLPHLVVATTTEAATALKSVLASLLFELSDGIPDQLVHNVGFGCAAGLLQCLGLPLTAPMPDVQRQTVATDPITGQQQSMEIGVQEGLPEMTREEEREADRLFTLFERFVALVVVRPGNILTLPQTSLSYSFLLCISFSLCRLRENGVISVENPVVEAARAGRIQELSDSDSDCS